MRALTIHSFTNQPVRLLRVLRYAARMGFKMESRTQEWFDLAIERDLHHTITTGRRRRRIACTGQGRAAERGAEGLGRARLARSVSTAVLAKKHPDYEAIDAADARCAMT